jgi:hypothetical protein
MKKTLIALTATAPLALLVVWTANAYPISPTSPSRNNLVEPVGCAGGPSPEDRCPYGYRIVGEKGRRHCAPCGSRYRDGDDRYYEPRRYREYDDRYNQPRRYRDYDDGYSQPRRYPREYY